MAKKVTKKVEELEAPVSVESLLSELDASKMYTFISNGKHKNLPEGEEFQETGEVCAILISKGYGEIKK